MKKSMIVAIATEKFLGLNLIKEVKDMYYTQKTRGP